MSLSTADLEVRSVQLEIMKQRLIDCEDNLRSVCENIPFSINNGCLVKCPVNTQHFIAAKSYDKHVNICKYKQKGIAPGEIKKYEKGTEAKGQILTPNILEYEIIERVRGKEIGSQEYEMALQEIASRDVETTENEKADSLHYSYEALQRARGPRDRAILYDYSVLKSKLSSGGVADRPLDPFVRIRRSEIYAKSESAVSKEEEVRDSKRRRKSYKGGKRMKLKFLKEQTKELIDLYMNKFCTEEKASEDSDN